MIQGVPLSLKNKRQLILYLFSRQAVRGKIRLKPRLTGSKFEE